MILASIVVALVAFGKNSIGIVSRPYETYRRITDHGTLWELAFLGFVLAFYFALASAVKTAAFRPFLLTRQFVLLAGSAALTYLIVVVLMWEVGKLVGGKGTIRAVLLGWGYTLVPTTLWFLATSVLYVLLPPPRTDSPAGIAFSVLFLMFSTALFFWKFMLAYLTMRFGLHLDVLRIAVVAGICLPLLGLYSVLMYRWGIFRVPFL